MPIYQVTDKKTIAPLFTGWNQTMIWSCLGDCMGKAFADSPDAPASAQIVTGPFCYFAGEVSDALIQNHLGFAFDMVPQNDAWAKAIERIYGDGVSARMRYATKKDPSSFDVPALERIIESLPAPYAFAAIDRAIYAEIMASDWAADLCENFENADDFLKNGIGFVIHKQGEIVSGASSYTYYKEGIEVEIDTREDARRQGLALACGAKLIVECLRQRKYPSWDAHNAGSLALSKKLRYRFDQEYLTYEFVTEA